MKIVDMLSKIEEGQEFDIDLNVTVGETDVHALNLLSFLYNEIGDEATYETAERILTEAVWWHVTFNTLISTQDNKRPGA